MTNYYTILRVTENATTEEIKSAYRALAKEYHPDVNPNNPIAEEYFKKVNEAYSVLSDPIKRNWYALLRTGNLVFQNTDPRKYGTRHRYPDSDSSKKAEISEDNSRTPFWLKQLVLLLAMAWALLIIFNNWFTTYEGNEMAEMVFSFLLFIVAGYFYINNLYNKWRLSETVFNPESRSLKYFLILFFLTIPAFFVIGYARKTVHLKFYPNITEARVIEHEHRDKNNWMSILYFDEKNLAYKKDFDFKSNQTLKELNYKVLIKFSTMEPRIMQFKIKLLGEDTIYQRELDDLNEGTNYFKDETID